MIFPKTPLKGASPIKKGLLGSYGPGGHIFLEGNLAQESFLEHSPRISSLFRTISANKKGFKISGHPFASFPSSRRIETWDQRSLSAYCRRSWSAVAPVRDNIDLPSCKQVAKLSLLQSHQCLPGCEANHSMETTWIKAWDKAHQVFFKVKKRAKKGQKSVFFPKKNL